MCKRKESLRQGHQPDSDYQQQRRPIDETRLKTELSRILEYPPQDRIKRLRFFINSNPQSSILRAAKEALNASLVEIGEAPTEIIEEPQPEEAATPSIEEEVEKIEPTTTTTAATATNPPENESTTAPPAPKEIDLAVERRLKGELTRILEYPPADRIKRLQYFIKSNRDSQLIESAQQALDSALAEAGEPAATAAPPAKEPTEGIDAAAGLPPPKAVEAASSVVDPVEQPGTPIERPSGALRRLVELPLEDRIKGLRGFIQENSKSPAQETIATEALVAALAESGDEKLKARRCGGWD
ncbi:MAG: hypothetical protein WKF84_02170 [Pyrinomonadaceae bacterium]